MNNINNIPVEDYIPDLVGTSADGKSLDMILKDRDEIIAWYKLIEPEMPRVCPECFRLIDDIELISPRVELPIDPESVPLAMNARQYAHTVIKSSIESMQNSDIRLILLCLFKKQS